MLNESSSSSSSSYYGSIPHHNNHRTASRDENSNKTSNQFGKWLSVTGLVIGSILGVFLVTMNTFPSSSSSSLSASFGSSPVDGTILLLSASNEYGDTKGNKFAYPFLESALLAEPYKVAKISIDNGATGCAYSWKISDEQGELIEEGTAGSSSFVISNLKKVGKYSLSVTEYDCEDSSLSRSIEQEVWVKYVRRELTSLTDSDREAFLDAMSTLWKVNTVDGKELYGPKYKSLHFFASIHNDAGANSVCDEFHGGTGFVNNHMMLGAYLEQSMQLVDPSTCLHYMEYTKYFSLDAFNDHLVNQLDGGRWTELLTDKWFGSNDPASGEIIDGRWAHAVVPRVDAQFFADHSIDADVTWFPQEREATLEAGAGIHMTNPYGLLRSPWNWNPSQYVARYNNVNQVASIADMDKFYRFMYSGDNCNNLATFVQSEVVGGTLSNFMQHCEDNIHGVIHFTFGGVGGDFAYEMNQKLKTEYGFNDIDLVVIARVTQTFVKNVYPFYNNDEKFVAGTSMEFPIQCTSLPWDRENEVLLTESEPGAEDAICSLNKEYFCASQDAMDSLLHYHQLMYPNSPLVKMDLDTQCEVMNIIISRAAFDGEMAGSGAALDPLFWVAHGAVERLMQKAVFENAFTDVTYSSDDQHCSGHMNQGTKYWLSGFYFSDESIAAESLTNVEIANILNPVTEQYRDLVNFVYDTDDYDYCSGSETWFDPSTSSTTV